MRPPLVLLFVLLVSIPARSAEGRPFSQALTPEQKSQLGLGGLTVAQWAALDAAVGAFARGETAAAVRQVEQRTEQKVREVRQEAEVKVQEASQQAAAADYRKKEEPGVVARTLEVFKRKQAEEKQKSERFTARVVGPFRGWSGGTYFPLENGQVWRQVGSESNDLPLVQNAEVEIFQSSSGYWRLRYDGAWITVKRLQ
jgi:hypothetical protein